MSFLKKENNDEIIITREEAIELTEGLSEKVQALISERTRELAYLDSEYLKHKRIIIDKYKVKAEKYSTLLEKIRNNVSEAKNEIENSRTREQYPQQEQHSQQFTNVFKNPKDEDFLLPRRDTKQEGLEDSKVFF